MSFYVYAMMVSYNYIPVCTVLTTNAGRTAVMYVLEALFLGDVLTVRDFIDLMVNFIGVGLVAKPSAVSADSEAIFGVVSLLIVILKTATSTCLIKSMGRWMHFLFFMLSYGV